jgi:Family of unknown function (DUF5941)
VGGSPVRDSLAGGPAHRGPSLGGLSLRSSSVSEPAISSPAVSEPAVSSPPVQSPAVSEPAVSSPSVSEPAARNSAVSGAVRGSVFWPARLPAAGRMLANTAVLEYLPRRFVGWAAERALAPISVTAISFVLGICAAAWFSGGTGPDNVRAVTALGGSYLAAWAAQLLISTMTDGGSSDPAHGDPAHSDPGESRAGETALDVIRTTSPIISGSPAASLAPAGSGAPAAWGASVAASAHQLARLIGALSEYAVYAGLAIGAEAAHWTGAWELATAVLVVWSVRQTMRACHGRAPDGVWYRQAVTGGWPVPGPPGADRLVLIAVVAPFWGARITLLALLSWAVAITCYPALAGRPAAGRSPESVARYRDDGRIARWLGRLVRGNLTALPPAIAGLAATGMVVLLGMQNLPGPLVLTPVVAMLLAAPGSSHLHIGRLDWLVPAILQAGQFLYVAALGFTCGVPAPLTFALCAMIALRYVALSDQAGWPPQADRLEPGGDLGWEGRMLVVGLGALAGATMFAYAALTAYLGVLICSKIMTICHSKGAGR